MKSANNQGPTGVFSEALFVPFGTFPLNMTFFDAFSLATFILCVRAIFVSDNICELFTINDNDTATRAIWQYIVISLRA